MMKKWISGICNLFGAVIIVLIVIACIPMTLPKIFGYQVFHIISGSMEPALPIGSAIYVEKTNPFDLVSGDIVAFYVDHEVVAHRIVSNDIQAEELMTQGDANSAPDRNPVTYQNVIGKVVLHIPYMGDILFLLSSKQGKVYLFCMLVAAVLLQNVARRMKKATITEERLQQIKEITISSQERQVPVTEERSGQMKKTIISRRENCEKTDKEKIYQFILVLLTIVMILFFLVVAVITKKLYCYYSEKKIDHAAIQNYTQQVIPNEVRSFDPAHCPIKVDFDELKEINPEIVAWIYCEDSVINYPVCRANDDEYYLHHSYDKKPKTSGAIFMETANQADCSDMNLILYGHHMKNKTMFATLSYWAEQEYYESHPFMWFLTPERTYRVDLFSGYITDARSDTYTVFQGYAPELMPYLEAAKEKSHFKAALPELSFLIKEDELEKEKFVVLSTCDYSFEGARYVLHGHLVEIV